MRHLIVGTAGHIDHGKTTLVKALTGTDTDRLKEEKERGISIELGFAFLTLPDGTRVGIVDVPGHERFVKTMLAGVGGIDLVVLVIAADEGVMPQTREHLHICELLQVKRGLVALTKADLVETDWLPLNIRRGANILESLAAAIKSASITPQTAEIVTPAQFKKSVRSLYLDHYKPVFFIFDQFEEFHRIQFALALVLADFVQRGLQKIGAVHAGDFNRVLEREEQAFAGALLGVEV